jgi:hypothetical protein
MRTTATGGEVSVVRPHLQQRREGTACCAHVVAEVDATLLSGYINGSASDCFLPI